jgi:membrane protease YdiL (CAAX protease family)
MINDSRNQYNSWAARKPRFGLVATALLFAGCLAFEMLPGKYLPPLVTFFTLGLVVLVLMPYVLGLPSGRKSLREYAYDIRLLPLSPVGRNIAIGLLMAALTLSSILLASLLTGHFVLDWGEVSPLRLVKGLTRGIWEEVFFRGILLVILMRMYSVRKAVLLATFIFSMFHLSNFSPGALVDILSIFFMGLLFAYLVLKTGSLLPGIIFHYVYDIFINFVQTTPDAEEPMKSILLFGFLWIALIIGWLLTKFIVDHWPGEVKIPKVEK